MGDRKIGFGIIGTGAIAEMHAKAIQALEDAELVGVYDKVTEKAAEFAETHKTKSYDDFDAFLGASDVEAVTIATPTGVHADVAVPAANAGKHILCEKPLDVTVERADSIIEACDRNGVRLSAVFQSRFASNVQLIKKALDAGRFGRLVLAGAQVKWFRSQEYYDSAGWRGTWALDGGGILMNQSIHTIDLLVYLAGDPAEVYAYTDTLTHERIEVEDTACAAVKFKNGALGVIEGSSSCRPGFPRRLEISGDKGSVVLEDDQILRWQFTEDQPDDERIREEGAVGEGLKGGSGDPKAINFEGHRRQIDDLLRAIQENRDPSLPGREGRKAVALICGIYESAKTGKPYKFE